MTEDAAQTVSKGEFAAMIGVTPGRVSQYIADRKIFGDAIEGDGRRARIRAQVAASQLKLTLDPAQRLGANGVAGRHERIATAESAPASRPELKTQPAELDEIAAERLKQMRLKTAAAERDEALANGRYMLADAARMEMGRVATEAFKVMEQGLRVMAEQLADQFGLPQRDLHLALQKSFRTVRERAASRQRAEAEGEPLLVADGGEDGRAAA